MSSILSVAVIISSPISVHAFELSGPDWSAGEATFHTTPLSTSGSGLTSAELTDAFSMALSHWNNHDIAFTYRTTSGSANPCAVPGSFNAANNDNGYTFASTSCGTAFGGSALAIATTWRQGSNGDGPIVQSGIVFNSASSWSVYSGSGGSGFDFRRVAVHELGHSLGLNHTSISPAIMRATIGTVEVPQTDDLNGLLAIYGSDSLSLLISPFIFLLLD